MTKIAILGGRVVDPVNERDEIANLYIEKGKIISILPSRLEDFVADHTIDAKDKIVCPGLVDTSATILTEDVTHQSVVSSLKLAAVAGITHLASHAFIQNRCLSPSEINDLSRVLNQSNQPKVYFIGALTQNLQGLFLGELMLFKEAGCIGVSNGTQPIISTLVKRHSYEYADMLGLKIFTALEDPFLAQTGCVHEGETSARLGLPGIPSISESLALVKELLLIEDTGVLAHFYRISTDKSVQILKESVRRHLKITSDVAIHQLFLTDAAVQLDNGLLHVRPPFASQDDLQTLRRALKEGVITAISSDHVSLSSQVKELPFQDSEPGIASWPLLLPLTLQLAEEENIPLLEAIKLITSAPAAALGIEGGNLNCGSLANLIVVDLNKTWSREDLVKFGSNTPFLNWPLRGGVCYTIIDGQIAYNA